MANNPHRARAVEDAVDQTRFHPSRRGLLQGFGLAAGTGVASTAAFAQSPAAAASSLPDPAFSGIDHVVVLMMENRSFDHFLGWLPGADGRQGGLTYRDTAGFAHPTHHLTTYQGCEFADPDHSVAGGRRQFNGGRCDGWLRTPGVTDTFPIGYYGPGDLPFLANAARTFTTCDRYFAALLGPTFPNRIYQHAAQTDRQTNTFDICALPTIWDRLQAAGVTHRYYFSDLPITALWGTRLLGITQPIAAFQLACKTGKLPAVCFIDPRFEDEDDGSSGDDHPHGDIRVGERFLADIYEAITSSPAWSRTVFIINFDEWGGFFDHVRPPAAPDADPKNTQRGFRVPCLVISPLARRRYVAHGSYDHTSILKMIEWRWGLAPLTPRDRAARNIAEVLDFHSRPNLSAPRWNVPRVPGLPCGLHQAVRSQEWAPLKALALRSGMAVNA